MISWRELRDDLDAVLDTVEAGETFRLAHDGVSIAEMRPIRQPSSGIAPGPR